MKTIVVEKLKAQVWNSLQHVPTAIYFTAGTDKYSMKKKVKLYRQYKKRKEKIENIKSSDTLAIMGSGPSINEIGEKDTEFLKTCDIFGMNYWVKHTNIIPDMLTIERTTTKFGNIISMINNRREYDDVVILAKLFPFFYREGSIARIVDRLNGHSLNLARIYRYKVEKKEDIDKQVYDDTNLGGPIPQITGSLDLCLSIAYLLGYEKIVLYGIDLSAGYFWNTDEVPPQTIHKTAKQTERSPISMFDVVNKFDKDILSASGKGIFLRSKRSNLYPKIKYLDL